MIISGLVCDLPFGKKLCRDHGPDLGSPIHIRLLFLGLNGLGLIAKVFPEQLHVPALPLLELLHFPMFLKFHLIAFHRF